MKRQIISSVALGGGVAAALAGFFFYHPDFRVNLVIVANEAAHLILFAALAWAAYFLGRVAARVAFRQDDTFWEVNLALGFAIFGVAAFALAALHLLYPWVIRAVVLLTLGLSAPLLARYIRSAPSYIAERWRGVDAGPAVLAAAAVPFVFVLLTRVGAPPVEWDVLVYHLYLPKVYAAAHGFVYLPRLAYASMPLGAEMMFMWAYLWDGLGVAAAVAPLFHGIMVVATWRLARRYVGNLWAVGAAVILIFTPNFAAAFAGANVDFILGALGLAALTVYLRGVRRPGDAALVGFFVGAAAAVKYTGAYVALALAAVIIYDLVRRRVRFRSAVLIAAVALIVFAPWLGKGFVERGNPVFPALYGVFGGRDLPPEVAAGLAKWQRGIGMGRSALDYLLLPYRLSVKTAPGYSHFDGVMWPFSMLTLLLAFMWFRRWRLVLFALVYLGAWAFLASQQLRFLSTAFGVFAAVSAGVFAGWTEKFPARVRRRVAAALFAVIIVAGYVINISFVSYAADGLLYLSSRDAEAYLSRLARCYRADKFINENLPGDARVLMIFENHLLYIERPAIYDSFFEASETLTHIAKLNTPGEVAAYVAGLGATHILTSRFSLDYFWGFYEPATRALWERYLERYTVVIYDDGENEVRAIIRR